MNIRGITLSLVSVVTGELSTGKLFDVGDQKPVAGSRGCDPLVKPAASRGLLRRDKVLGTRAAKVVALELHCTSGKKTYSLGVALLAPLRETQPPNCGMGYLLSSRADKQMD